jgi:hypothetical protein
VNRRRFLTLLATVAAGLLAGRSIARAGRVVVERHVAPLAGLAAPLRVAFVADLHAGPYADGATLRRWVDAIAAERPELVLLGGDLVDQMSGPEARASLLDAVAVLAPPLGAWAVWGNHDHHVVRDVAAFARELEVAGVGVLVNEAVRLREDLVVAGIDDLRAGRPDLPAALAGRPSDVATVLVSHNPDVLPKVPGDVGLTLAGHTHGGQVCLPGGVPIVTSSRFGRRFASGWVRAPGRGYVTRGLGVGWLPIRAFCPPELTVLELEPDA